jgi:hypothetical protein
MLQRPLLTMGVLAAAAGVPYVLMNEGLRNSAQGAINQALGRAANDPLALPDLGLSDITWANTPRPANSWAEDPPVLDLAEVFRLEITPAWVTHRWSRVTTVSAEAELLTMRIPLVTGPNPNDLAGSLTYYFDKKHQLQRITFFGHTGDPQRLLEMASGPLRMKPVPTLAAALYVTPATGKPTSAIRITHLPVVRSNTPNHKHEIALELNRPGGSALSEEMQELLDHDRALKRW